jgi:hypothetical protein
MPRTSGRIERLAFALYTAMCLMTQSDAHSQARPQSQASSPPILVTATAPSRQQELRQVVDSFDKCTARSQYLNHPISVGAFIGGKVTAIRIVRFSQWTGTPAAKDKMQETLSRVWNGKFQYASCQLAWDEGTLWTIEADIEFADGTQRELLTDGSHVAFQDFAGKNWFVRLLPAAQ